MAIMAAVLLICSIFTYLNVPKNIGKIKNKTSFKNLFSKSKEINVLSLSRFFLFGSRDIWFVIGLPVFLQSTLGWSYTYVGSFMAFWIIGYGLVQSLVPKFLNINVQNISNRSVSLWTLLLALFPGAIAILLSSELDKDLIVITGLFLFGVVFAVNSIIHSYLVLAYSKDENVSGDVGFYYMANACGRLVGTLLSGWVYQSYGFTACLWYSVVFIIMASIVSLYLPKAK